VCIVRGGEVKPSFADGSRQKFGDTVPNADLCIPIGHQFGDDMPY
jgi:hypothetical protein